MSSRRVSLALAILSAASLWGCGKNQQGGELGTGTFTYHCVEPSDAQCDVDEQGSSAALQFLMVGGKFGLTYRSPLYTPEDFTFESAPKRLEWGDAPAYGDPQTVTPLVTGYTGIVALHTDAYSSADNLIHVHVFQPTGIQISERQTGGPFTGELGGVSVTVQVAATLTLRAVATNDAGDILAGALACDWTSSDPNVVAITAGGHDNVATIEPKAAGTADLHVTLGPLEATTTLEVQP